MRSIIFLGWWSSFPISKVTLLRGWLLICIWVMNLSFWVTLNNIIIFIKWLSNNKLIVIKCIFRLFNFDIFGSFWCYIGIKNLLYHLIDWLDDRIIVNFKGFKDFIKFVITKQIIIHRIDVLHSRVKFRVMSLF